MTGDWVDLIVTWLPLVVFLLVVAFLLPIMKRQQDKYAKHLQDVSAINEENRALSREGQRIATETLAVLQDIKILLKDGKP